jgi:hypothetical protein
MISTLTAVGFMGLCFAAGWLLGPRRFYLTVAIIASITCVIWCVVTVLFVWNTAHRDFRLLFPLVLLGGGAATFFHWYRKEPSSR